MFLDHVQTRRALHQLTAIDMLDKGWDEFSSWVKGIKGHSAYRMYSYANHAGVICSDKEILVVFEGTNDPIDLAVDLHFKQAVTPSGNIHSGFYGAWRGYEGQLCKILQRVDPERNLPIYVTGHSLGAALALIAGNFLVRSGYILRQSFVFGAPMVGDINWVLSCEQAKAPLMRIVNDQDIVPRLPFIFGYRETSHPVVYLDSKGRIRDTRPFSPCQSLLSVFGGDHALHKYMRKMELYRDKLP